MSEIGVEVGQKMRSAIKAKLTELDCYVDDELPDYIMVMIANRRTKSQMKEDLNLFLSSKTSQFVEWLHIVLKKLKEVQVTNPDIFKKPLKRKTQESFPISEDDLKKVKKEKIRKVKKEERLMEQEGNPHETEAKSLTDDLPVTANKISQARKIVVLNEKPLEKRVSEPEIDEHDFDIPLLSEINASNEEELQLIEKKIRNVKSRLGIQVESETEEDNDEDLLTIKPDPGDLLLTSESRQEAETRRKEQINQEEETAKSTSSSDGARTPSPLLRQCRKISHSRITFDEERDSLKAKADRILKPHLFSDKSPTKKSVHERLGSHSTPSFRNKSPVSPKKGEFKNDRNDSKSDKHDFKPQYDSRDARRKLTQLRSRETPTEANKSSILSRIEVMSKVSIPPKRPRTPQEEINEDEEMKRSRKDVPSVVRIKPRILPAKSKQANPNLLFKAVADAQRSVTQTPSVGNKELLRETVKKHVFEDNTKALFTKKYKEQMQNLNNKSDEKKDDQKYEKVPKISESEKNKLKLLINSNTKGVREAENGSKDIQTNSEEFHVDVAEEDGIDADIESDSEVNQNFVVTLDGLKDTHFNFDPSKGEAKTIVKLRKNPSPIIFKSPEKPVAIVSATKTIATKTMKPEILKALNPLPISRPVKIKENCKYWPNCHLADQCAFNHPKAVPATQCKNFPNCKFGEKCLYSHPPCKFQTSCTKKDCPFSHQRKPHPKKPFGGLQSNICKYFPNCNNANCQFLHPKMCKYGSHCRNQNTCAFVHSPIVSASNLIWKAENKF